jgi:hypothetical protein
MRKTLPALALSLSLVSAPLYAGGLDVPVIQAPVIVADTGSSASHDWIVPLFLLLTLAAAAN